LDDRLKGSWKKIKHNGARRQFKMAAFDVEEGESVSLGEFDEDEIEDDANAAQGDRSGQSKVEAGQRAKANDWTEKNKKKSQVQRET
jgi:hypothetical protein